MSKGGSPMGGGGFGGQQSGFGGGFGGGFNPMPQQGFGGGFGGQQGGFGNMAMPQQQQQGFGGRYQPSRQRFNQMPQQQGFGGGYGMPQQQGFGGGFNQMPQQQGFGGGFGGGFNQMPQQQQQGGFGGIFGGGFGGQQPMLSNARYTGPQRNVDAMTQGFNQMRQQGGFGGGFNMPQQQPMYGGDTPMAPQQRPMLQPGSVSNISAGGLSKEYLDQMREAESQPQRLNGPSTDMNAMMDPFRQQANQMMQPALGQPGGNLAAQDAALRSRGMPTSNEIDFTDPRRGMGINIAQPPEQQPQAQTNQPPATPSQLGDMLRGMGGGSQPGPQQQQTPPNPYAQQTYQEDPRMQAIRMMQRMRFGGGGGGGYNF